jgi:hypothetical protein
VAAIKICWIEWYLKGCSVVSIPLEKLIFNFNFATETVPAEWKEGIIVPAFKKGNKASVSTYRPITLLSTFPKVQEFVTHGHISHYFKAKVNS